MHATILRLLGLSLLLALSACSSNSTTSSPMHGPAQSATALPGVALLDGLSRSSSVQVPLKVAEPQLTHGTTPVGEDLAFTADASGLRFAVYRIKPHVQELNSLVLGGENGLTILLADFAAQRWIRLGAISGGFAVVPLPAASSALSEDGYLYCAVAAPDGVVGLLTSLALDRGGPEHIYFVETPANGGDDANDGSEEHPWATLQHAADLCVPGTLVMVGAGDFEAFELNAGGTAAAPITFRGGPETFVKWKDGLNAVVTLDDTAGELAYVTLENLRITNNGLPHGIRVTGGTHGPAHHITLTGLGFNGATDSTVLFDNVADSLIYEVFENFAGTYAIHLTNGTARVTVKRCQLQLDSLGCILCDNGATDLTIEANFLNGNDGTYGIVCRGLTNSRIRNNLVVNHTRGIEMEPGTVPSAGNDIFNNTVYSDQFESIGIAFFGEHSSTRVYNNILYSEGDFGAGLYYATGSTAGIDSDYNILTDQIYVDVSNYTLAQWQALGTLEQHSKAGTAAETFTDISSFMYSLLPEAPAKGAAYEPYVPEEDHYGHVRFFNTMDCGCI